MTFVLDTNTCSYLLKRTHPELIHRVRAFRAGELAVSSISAYELYFGVARLSRARRLLRVLDAFLGNLNVLPFDEPAAFAAGEVRAELERAGSPIGAHDLLIAGHVRALGATLVTNNTHEFTRVRDLQLENWVGE